jgi:hypothetical protein
MEESKNAFKILTGKSTGRSLLGRPKCRWKDSIRRILKKLVSIRGTGLILLRIGIIEEYF